MGRAAVLACLVLAIAAALWTGTAAQSSCGSVLYTLVQCLSFVQGVSSTPAPSCCSALGSLIKSQPECLCWLRNSTVSDQDKARALTLPSICNVETPSITLCNGTATSTPSPAGETNKGGSSSRMTWGVFVCAVFFAVAPSLLVI